MKGSRWRDALYHYLATAADNMAARGGHWEHDVVTFFVMSKRRQLGKFARDFLATNSTDEFPYPVNPEAADPYDL